MLLKIYAYTIEKLLEKHWQPCTFSILLLSSFLERLHPPSSILQVVETTASGTLSSSCDVDALLACISMSISYNFPTATIGTLLTSCETTWGRCQLTRLFYPVVPGSRILGPGYWIFAFHLLTPRCRCVLSKQIAWHTFQATSASFKHTHPSGNWLQ